MRDTSNDDTSLAGTTCLFDEKVWSPTLSPSRRRRELTGELPDLHQKKTTNGRDYVRSRVAGRKRP